MFNSGSGGVVPFLEEDKLLITKGKSGEIIDENILKQRIIENIKNQFNGNNESVYIPTKYAEPSEIDIEKIRQYLIDLTMD